MTGTTAAPWSIPYPTGTDKVADGDNAIRSLAERVATLLDTYTAESDVAVPAAPGTTNTNSWVYRRGRMVTLAYEVAPQSSFTTASLFMTIPAGYRPVRRIMFTVNGASVFYMMTANSDGTVVLLSPSTHASGVMSYGHVTYPLA